ncbi:hypothetical protein SCOCK_300116 [Actinacidiphila cocklensis]|uniref:Uncharacterized protein n=1 Tax=Actinacidiphila cocklensis TaxID=887465 RepID=A0A9W4DTJ4_9ACTN|nr:hypothetical protein SCOCK_300116 [Actinacidiphila cocklensis]
MGADKSSAQVTALIAGLLLALDVCTCARHRGIMIYRAPAPGLSRRDQRLRRPSPATGVRSRQ